MTYTLNIRIINEDGMSIYFSAVRFDSNFYKVLLDVVCRRIYNVINCYWFTYGNSNPILFLRYSV